MIILPHTPPIPTILQANADSLSPQAISTRTALSSSAAETYNDLVRYVINAEEYVEELFQFTSSKANSRELPFMMTFANEHKLLTEDYLPWKDVVFKDDKKLKFLNKKQPWTLFNEIEVSIIATSLIYIRLGAELVNELIELEPDSLSSEEINEKWKQVVTFYKKSISFIQYGIKINSLNSENNHLPGSLFILIEKIGHINIQMSTLSKFSWINRNSFNETELFKSNNNGTLCRVAIYVVDELKTVKSLIGDVQDNLGFTLSLNSQDWLEYLTLIERYANAYAGLFLSIELYQQNKLGQAIGLVNYSLLNLQSKRMGELNPKKSPIVTKLKSKFSTKKNESYIKNLQSITSLNLNSSSFTDKSGIVLKDITYVFDQLVQLHLKFTKENDNIVFDTVTNYQDIHKDNKWPLGSKIPVSDVPDFIPRVFNILASKSTRSNYY